MAIFRHGAYPSAPQSRHQHVCLPRPRGFPLSSHCFHYGLSIPSVSHGCGTVIAITHYQRDDVKSGDSYNVIQGAAMNTENRLFQPVKFGAIYPMLGAQAFVGALAAQEHAF
jgi:hypothetical protein